MEPLLSLALYLILAILLLWLVTMLMSVAKIEEPIRTVILVLLLLGLILFFWATAWRVVRAGKLSNYGAYRSTRAFY